MSRVKALEIKIEVFENTACGFKSMQRSLRADLSIETEMNMVGAKYHNQIGVELCGFDLNIFPYAVAECLIEVQKIFDKSLSDMHPAECECGECLEYDSPEYRGE